MVTQRGLHPRTRDLDVDYVTLSFTLVVKCWVLKGT